MSKQSQSSDTTDIEANGDAQVPAQRSTGVAGTANTAVNGSTSNGSAKDAPLGQKTTREELGEKPYNLSEQTYPWRDIGSYNVGRKFDSSFVANSNAIRTYITENLHFDWYWNTGLIIGTCIFSWLVARLGFGIFGLVFVLLGTASVYKAEFRRFERNVRDDIERISAAERLEKSFESMEWMNSFLTKFWVIYMPALSDTVKTIANDTLKDIAPGYGIEALTLDEFTLGSKAPRIDSIKSYTKKGEDIVEWDWTFSFTPDDTSDMTKKEIDRKINPKVALGVRVGKSFVSKSLPILVEDMSVSGRVKITLNLSHNFPHIKIASIQLLEPPKIDFALKPVGGDTFGLDIMSLIPGLSSLITTIINSNAGPMLYAPNHLDIDVEEIMAAQSSDATGVIAVTVKSAEDLRDTINPYIQFFTDSDPTRLTRTDVKAQTRNPNWSESKYLLVNDLYQKLHFDLYDFDVDKKKGELYGSHEFELRELLQQDAHVDLSKSILSAGQKKGSIKYDIRWFPVIRDEGESSKESSEVDAPDSEVGIFKLKLHQAKDLDISTSITGQLNPKAELYINGKLSKEYRTLKRANEPTWEETLEILVTQKASTNVKLIIYDTSSATGHKIIGVLEESLDSLVFEVREGNDFFKLSPQGQVRLTAEFKPVSLSGVSGSVGYVPPIGVVRLHLREARDLLNLETIGKVDPYVKVLLNNRLRYQTTFHPDTLNPVFDEVIYLPIISETEHITLEVMDDQNVTKDRALGSTVKKVQQIIKKGPNGAYLFYDGGDKILTAPLQLKHRQPKGELLYSVSFLPTIPVYSTTELKELDEKKARFAAKAKKQQEELEAWEELYKKHPKDYEWIDVQDLDDEDDGTAKEKLSLDQLLTYRSGILGFHIEGGKVKKPDTFVQILLDDIESPSFVSSRTAARKVNPEVGDAFVRDLPNSKIIFRNTKKAFVRDAEHIIEESHFNTVDLLKKGFYEPTIVHIGSSSVNIRFEYIPSAIKLPPSETLLDTGRAQIEFLDAENLQPADSNGKADPFVSVKLGNIELFKSKIIKRTLNPTWNEVTTIPIPSRSRSKLQLLVYDWDRAAKNDLIGQTKLDIANVKPLTTEIVTFQLQPQGSVRARVTFVPEYIRPEVGEAQYGIGFSALAGVPLKGVGAAASLATGVVGGGVGVATGAVGVGVGAVGKGGSLLKGVFNGKKNKQPLDQPRRSVDNYSNDVQSLRSGRSRNNLNSNEEGGAIAAAQRQHSRTSSQTSTFSTAVRGKKTTEGELTIHSGTNLGSQAQLRVSLAIDDKLKEIFHTKNIKSSNGIIRWEEEISFDAPIEAEVVFGGVVHRTFSKDQELGTAKIKLSEVVDNPRDITLNLGQGQIVVSFKYSPEAEDDNPTPPPPGW